MAYTVDARPAPTLGGTARPPLPSALSAYWCVCCTPQACSIDCALPCGSGVQASRRGNECSGSLTTLSADKRTLFLVAACPCKFEFTHRSRYMYPHLHMHRSSLQHNANRLRKHLYLKHAANAKEQGRCEVERSNKQQASSTRRIQCSEKKLFTCRAGYCRRPVT